VENTEVEALHEARLQSVQTPLPDSVFGGLRQTEIGP